MCKGHVVDWRIKFSVGLIGDLKLKEKIVESGMETNSIQGIKFRFVIENVFSPQIILVKI